MSISSFFQSLLLLLLTSFAGIDYFVSASRTRSWLEYDSCFFMALPFNFLFAKRSMRFLALSLAFVLLFSAHSLFVNLPPHPIAISDALLFAVALGSSAFMNIDRWQRIFILVPLSLLPSLPWVTSRPWIPNELAGVNQSAYLIGLASLSAFSLLFVNLKSQWFRWIGVGFLLISSSLLWMMAQELPWFQLQLQCMPD